MQGSDSARYRMWGNGIALPNAEYVIGCAKKLIEGDNMHIMSDEQYNRLMAMKAYLEDPAPLPMWDDEDTDLRAVYPEDPEPAEDESWTK